jgi:hypothetical protein
MPRHPTAAVLAGLIAWAPAAASAETPRPVVVELFTSQSCYSCPPAEAFLGELATRPGIVALEWHVDYWNDITYGSAGQWVDPFSSPAATERQVRYNQAIRGTGAVYTPQMVIDGRTELVGSRRDEVEAALLHTSPDLASLATAWDGATVTVDIDGTTDQPTDVWLVRFVREQTTDVSRGENHGKLLQNRHVVTAAEHLGSWPGGPARFRLAGPDVGAGCAVLLQQAEQGPILAAALCPDRPSS